MFPTTKPVYRYHWSIIAELHRRFFETEASDSLDEETLSVPDIESDEDLTKKSAGSVDRSEPRPISAASAEGASEESATSYNAAVRKMELRPESRTIRVRPPPWSIGIDPQFYKDIDKADKKHKGVSSLPLRTWLPSDSWRGATRSPHWGRNYRKYWRYRIGDYRLIFLPDEAQAQIT